MKIKPILRYYIQISEMNFEYNVTYVYWEILAVLKWGSTNTGWHINAHHMIKLYTHEVKLNIMGIWEWGISFMAYNGWGILGVAMLKWVGQL